MLKIHHIASTSFRTWGADVHIVDPEPESTSPTNLSPEQSLGGAGSWFDIDEEPMTVAVSKPSNPTPLYPGNSNCTSRANLRCSTPTTHPTLNSPALASDSHPLEIVAFPPHATHLLPSEPNGTWRTQAQHALKHPSEAASTLREAIEQYTHEFDVPALFHKLEQVAEDRKADVNEWLNQTFADYDLVEMHSQVQRLVQVPPILSMRQLDYAVDAVAEIAQSLRSYRSQPDLLDNPHDDKYDFARLVGRKARRALLEQGICKEWQFLSDELAGLNNSMASALFHTFARVQLLLDDVPLFRAKPLWVADRYKKAWRLELDVGVVGVEIGHGSDRALVELGFLYTGFELAESSGCVSIMDLDRQAQDVEDEWQLLES